MGLVVTELLITSLVVSWRGWEPPPASGCDLRIATALGACALVLGENGLDPQIDTAFDVTGRDLLTATDRVDSVRVSRLSGSSRSRDLPRRSHDRSRSLG